MTTISHINTVLNDLVETQKEAANSLDNVIDTIRNARSSQSNIVTQKSQTLVVTGDDDRYAALTRAARVVDSQHDFTAMVQRWTQEDATNRSEKQGLEKTWGSNAEVAQKVTNAKSELDLVAQALNEVAPEIEQFDRTTQKISAHNEKYAKRASVQITRDSFDKYAKSKWWQKAGRLLLCCVGYLGPWRAQKIVTEYSAKYGNYFEDAANITKMRENEKNLEANKAGKKQSYDEVHGVQMRMSALDSSYKGPEGIASQVRGMVRDLVAKNVAFGDGLIAEVHVPEAAAAVTAGAKLRALGTVEAAVEDQRGYAQSVLSTLRDAQHTVANAVDRVGDQTIYSFNSGDLETAITETARYSRTLAREAKEAAASVAAYQPADGASSADIDRHAKSLGDVKAEKDRIQLDFSHLKRGVNDAVQAYEAEQERLRQLELQRQREIAAAAAAVAAAQRRREEESRMPSPGRTTDDFNNVNVPSAPISEPDDISSGNEGVSSRRDDDIDMGGGGIKPRI